MNAPTAFVRREQRTQPLPPLHQSAGGVDDICLRLTIGLQYIIELLQVVGWQNEPNHRSASTASVVRHADRSGARRFPLFHASAKAQRSPALHRRPRRTPALSRALSITPPHVVVSGPAPHAKRCLTLLVRSCGSPQPRHSRHCWQKAVLPSETSG